MNKIILCVFALLLLTACADPRNQASADVMRLQAEQDLADQKAARELRAEQNGLEMDMQRATEATRMAGWNMFWFWTSRAATLAVCLLILAGGAGGSIAAVGGGWAASVKMALLANTISLDPKTGQYPLLRYKGRGKYTLTNPNTGQTLYLDTRNEADRHMIAASGAVQLSGIVSYNAMLSKHPDGVALVGTSPMMIDTSEDR